jgi:hypothetical protein
VTAAAALLGAAAVLLLTATAGPARAEGTTAPPAADAPHALCRLTDPRLPELSGLVVSGDKMLAIDDGGDRITVYVLDTACRVVDARTADVDPYDPEDLALGRDGTVWLADTGDNNTQRATVALLALRPDGTTAVYRLSYPDGPHDAESLLLAPDGTPYVVTKDVTGHSGVYRPVSAPVDGGTVALAKVAALAFGATGTPGGPVGPASALLATGGAVSPDGRLVAVRTYTDAYLWPLTGSDVPAALARTPVRIPLPASPQGEAIAFAADGRHLVVAGEGLPGDVTVVPLPADLVPAAATAATGATAGTAGGGHAGVPTVTAGVIAAVAATLAVWIGGKLRRRHP